MAAIKVVPEDCPKLGYCFSGVRRLFRKHGLDFRDFIRNGIDIDKLYATGEPTAVRAADYAKAKHNKDVE